MVNSRGDSIQPEITNFSIQFNQLNPRNEVKIRCRQFIDELIHQTKVRLQLDAERFERSKFLSPMFVIGSKGKPQFKHLPDNPLKTSTVEEQYNQVDLIKWADYLEDPAKDTERFWLSVRDFREGKFKELSEYVIYELLDLLSNASIEPIFSVAGATKTKSRNKMLIATLDAIVRLKLNPFQKNECFKNFDFTPCLNYFNSSMYN